MATTTIYCNATSGSDSNDGSEGSPYLTLNKALAIIDADTTSTAWVVNLTGTFREFLNTITKSNVTIQTDPASTTRALLTGGSTAPAANGTRMWKDSGSYTWASASYTTDGNAFYASANALPADIVGVTINWETSTDAYGRRYGHLVAAADLTAVKATDKSYWIDTTNKRVYVNPNGSPGSMSGLTMRVIRGGSGLTATAGLSNITINNLDFGPHCDADPDTTAYNLVFDSVSYVTISGCRFYDGGYHNMGWTGSGDVKNCIISNSHAYGCRNSGATAWVVNSTAGVIEDVEYINCTAHLYGRLDEAGTETAFSGTPAPKGFYSHGPGSGNATIRKLTYRNCDVIAYGSTLYSIGWGSQDSTLVDDYTYFKGYPIKIIDCRGYNLGCIFSMGGCAAVQRGYFNAEDFVNGHGDNTGTVCIWQSSTSGAMYIEAAQLVTNTGVVASGSRNFINWRGALCLLNCLLVDYSELDTLSRTDYFIQKTTGATKIKMLQNIFARMSKTTFTPASTGSFCNFYPVVAGANWDSNLTDVDIKGNAYIGITKPGWPGGTPYDSFAEWATDDGFNQAETAGTMISDQYPTANNRNFRFAPFETVFATPRQGWLANVTKNKRTGYAPEQGINGQRYDGSIGPYQEGDKFTGFNIGFGARRDRSRSVTRAT